jgi:hypothetical protein
MDEGCVKQERWDGIRHTIGSLGSLCVILHPSAVLLSFSVNAYLYLHHRNSVVPGTPASAAKPSLPQSQLAQQPIRHEQQPYDELVSANAATPIRPRSAALYAATQQSPATTTADILSTPQRPNMTPKSLTKYTPTKSPVS